MRTFGTIFLGFLFLLVFDACFVVHAVGGYPLDASAVTSTMRDAKMYDSVMEGLDLALKQSVSEARDPALAKEIGGGMKDALEESMTEPWFYETFEKAYGGFVAHLEGSDEDVEIDLSEQKESLEDYLDEVAKKYGAGDPNAKQDLKKVVDVLPEKATVAELLEDSGALDEKGLKSARDTISTFKTVRIVLLVFALGLLGLIALVAKKTTKRLLVSVGAVLLVSSLFYLGTTGLAGDAFWSEVEAGISKPKKGDKSDEFARETTKKLFEGAMSDAFGRSNLPVGGIAGMGLLMIAAAFVVGRNQPKLGAGGLVAAGPAFAPVQPYAPPGHGGPQQGPPPQGPPGGPQQGPPPGGPPPQYPQQ